MRLITISRKGCLGAGKVLMSNETGLSYHGEQYWSNVLLYTKRSCTQKINPEIKMHIIEHLFEEVRLADFPSFPSRFCSIFASTPEHFYVWQDKLNPDGCFPVYEIETDVMYEFDAALLEAFGEDENHNEYFEPSFARDCARLYWGGRTIKDNEELAHLQSEMECIIPLPVKVIRRLTDKEIRIAINRKFDV